MRRSGVRVFVYLPSVLFPLILPVAKRWGGGPSEGWWRGGDVAPSPPPRPPRPRPPPPPPPPPPGRARRARRPGAAGGAATSRHRPSVSGCAAATSPCLRHGEDLERYASTNGTKPP